MRGAHLLVKCMRCASTPYFFFDALSRRGCSDEAHHSMLNGEREPHFSWWNEKERSWGKSISFHVRGSCGVRFLYPKDLASAVDPRVCFPPRTILLSFNVYALVFRTPGERLQVNSLKESRVGEHRRRINNEVQELVSSFPATWPFWRSVSFLRPVSRDLSYCVWELTNP